MLSVSGERVVEGKGRKGGKKRAVDGVREVEKEEEWKGIKCRDGNERMDKGVEELGGWGIVWE